MRLLILRGGDGEKSGYCAISPGSGTAVALTSTRSVGGKGKDFPAEDVSKIDKVEVLISSDEATAYSVDGFCLKKIVFGY